MDTPATLLTEVSKLTARERRLISSYHGKAATMQPEPDKLAALIDAVRALDAVGVPYAPIGGLAVGIYAAVPRATVDVDDRGLRLGGERGGARRDRREGPP
jgi:hypothetical protein